MNDQLQQALAAILEKTMKGIDAGVTFLSGELPDVIHQLLLWKLTIGLMIVFGGVLAFTVGVITLRYIFKRPELVTPEIDGPGRYQRAVYKDNVWYDKNGDPREVAIPALFTSCIFTIGGAAVAVCNIATPLQIWIAPKLFLIEYAARLVK